MLAHLSDSFFGIFGRHGIVAVGHAVLQHNEGDALTVEEWGPVCALMLHGQMVVSATGAADDGASRCFFLVGQEHGYLGQVLRIAIVCFRAFGP